MKSKQFICPYCGNLMGNQRMKKRSGKPTDSTFTFHYCGTRMIKVFDHLMVEEKEDVGATDGNAEQVVARAPTQTQDALGPPSRRRRKELEELEAQIQQEDNENEDEDDS